eukprot:200828-Lingulodinium_polyedra.AAC.1
MAAQAHATCGAGCHQRGQGPHGSPHREWQGPHDGGCSKVGAGGFRHAHLGVVQLRWDSLQGASSAGQVPGARLQLQGCGWES